MSSRATEAPPLAAGPIVPRGRDREAHPVELTMLVLLAIAIGILVILPLVAGTGTVLVMGRALVVALFALSLNLLIGTLGLISLGHAAFFGFGSYTLALLVSRQEWSPLVGLALAPVTAAAAAFLAGLVVLRLRSKEAIHYVALLTFAIAQVCWAIAHGWVDLTGGENGVVGLFAPSWLATLESLYWAILGCVAVCTVVLYVITRSPFGDALRGIRENRLRAEFLGMRVQRYELAAFVLAGMFAGIAGALSAMWEGQATDADFFWETGALALIAALLGGIRWFLGPIAGAVFYIMLQDKLVDATVLWELLTGVVVVLVALFMPGGLVGAVHGIARAVVENVWRRRPAPRVAAMEASSGLAAARPRAVDAPESTPELGSDGGAPYLELAGLRKAFGGLIATDDVSLRVRRHSMYAIIGPNGAGKSTLFNLITGRLKPDAGRVTFDGRDITGAPSWQLARLGISRSFQQATLFWQLPATLNVMLAEAVSTGTALRPWGGHPDDIRRRAEGRLGQVGVSQLGDVPVSELSHGDQRAVELAVALATDARLLLLDEPTAGLSAVEKRLAVELIRDLAAREGLTVVFIEHDIDIVFTVADWVTVLHKGAVLASGTPQAVRDDPRVQEAYLGMAPVDA